MICPHCEYNEYTIGDYGDELQAKEGYMFKFPVEMKRTVEYCDWLGARAEIYGCPSCHKLFIEELK